MRQFMSLKINANGLFPIFTNCITMHVCQLVKMQVNAGTTLKFGVGSFCGLVCTVCRIGKLSVSVQSIIIVTLTVKLLKRWYLMELCHFVALMALCMPMGLIVIQLRPTCAKMCLAYGAVTPHFLNGIVIWQKYFLVLLGPTI